MISALTDADALISLVFDDYFTRNERVLVEQNIMQMRKGLMPNGEPILPQYTWGGSYYAYRKRYSSGMNQFDLPERPYLAPNLGLTGAFYRGVHIVHEDDAVYFDSFDNKWDSAIEGYHGEPHAPLSARYGDVLGVPDEYMDSNVRPEMKEELITELRGQLGI